MELIVMIIDGTDMQSGFLNVDPKLGEVVGVHL